MIRMGRSWSIFKISFGLINERKQLLLFPLVSFFATLFLAALILGGGAAALTASGVDIVAWIQEAGKTSAQAQESGQTEIIGIVVFAILYLVSMLVATFFNTAFYSEIMKGLKGDDVSVVRGLQFSCSRFGAIFMWALLASTVGVMLKLLEERLGWLGQIIVKLIGLAWAVTTIFAVPVLVHDLEVVNPFQVLKRSAGAIKRTWGESLIGFMGLGALNFLAVVSFILYAILIGAVIVGCQLTGAAAIAVGATIAIAFLGMVACFYVVGVAEKVYIGSLYVYASENVIPNGFSEELMANPWKTKRR